MKKLILTICIFAISLLCLNAETEAKQTFELLDFSKIKVEGDISRLLDQTNPIRPKKGMLFINRPYYSYGRYKNRIPIARAVDNGVFIGNYEQRKIFIETDEMYADGDSLLFGIYECVGLQDTNMGRLYKLKQYDPMPLLGEEQKENCLDLSADIISSYIATREYRIPKVVDYFEPMDKVINRAYKGDVKALELLAVFFDDYKDLFSSFMTEGCFFWTTLLGDYSTIDYWNLKSYCAKVSRGEVKMDGTTYYPIFPEKIPYEIRMIADNGNIEAQKLCSFYDSSYRIMLVENKGDNNDFSDEHSSMTIGYWRTMTKVKSDFFKIWEEHHRVAPTR